MMSGQNYRVAVTKIIQVNFDPSKLDGEFWKEFNETITDRGGPDMDYLAEHAAWNFVQGDYRFIEGIGDLEEMNVTIREIDSDVEIESRPTTARENQDAE